MTDDIDLRMKAHQLRRHRCRLQFPDIAKPQKMATEIPFGQDILVEEVETRATSST